MIQENIILRKVMKKMNMKEAKNEQIKAIIKILSEHAEVLEFSKSYLQVDDINELAEEIWTMLG